MKRTALLALLLLFFLSVGTALAVEVTIFGPVEMTRERGQPRMFSTSFPANKGKATLIIRNGEAQGDHRVRAAWGWINQRPVIRPRDVTHHSYEMEILLRLEEQNSILMYVLGKPGDSLTFEIVQEVDWLSFQEGDPGFPGDHVLIEGIRVGDEWFDLETPVSLGHYPDGLTASLFFPMDRRSQELMMNPIFETLDLDDPDPCWFAFGAGLHFSGTTDYNGVEGFFLNFSATMIEDWIIWANELRSGCQLSPDDFYITGFAIWNLDTGLPVPALDAAIFLPGQNTLP